MALALGLLLRVLLLSLTPVAGPSLPGQLSSYNDELAHGHYVRHLLETGALPPHVEAIDAHAALARGEYENYQPPLYYLATAGLCALLGINDLPAIIRTGRALSLFSSFGFIVIFWLISREQSWPHRTVAASVIFLSLSAVLVRFTTTAGNEALFWLLAGAMLLTALRLARDANMLAPWLWFALVAVLGLYTKLSALLLLPLPVFALGRFWRAPRNVLHLAALYALIFAATLPVWLRNQGEFGSLLPLAAGFGTPAWRIPGPLSAAFAFRSFLFPWWEFWRGALGLFFMAPLAFVLAAGALRGGLRLLTKSPVLVAAFVIAIASFLWLNLRYDQAEARYLFSAWPALGVILCGEPPSDRRLWILLLVLLLPYSLMLLPAGG